MPTPAEFLKNTGERLDRYDRHRVARAGCFVALGLLAVLILAGVAGFVDPHPIFPRFFRMITLTALGGIIVVFLLFALAETVAERSAMTEIRKFTAGGGADIATLIEMARTRQGRYPGSEKVLALLERASGTPRTS